MGGKICGGSAIPVAIADKPTAMAMASQPALHLGDDRDASKFGWVASRAPLPQQPLVRTSPKSPVLAPQGDFSAIRRVGTTTFDPKSCTAILFYRA